MNRSRVRLGSVLFATASLIGLAMAARAAEDHEGKASPGAYPAPSALEEEHRKIHEDLVELLGAGGQTGEAAHKLATALHAHFGREQEISIPPLGLLVPLAEGKLTPEMKSQAEAGSVLRAELPKMLEEHGQIKAAAEALREAGEKEGKPEAVKFAEELILHAQNEEQVLYPAAILVADYVRLRSDS
ncbi:MAG: hypothetical protein ACE15D_04670 [Candidatus Eisenbacteria bacterium]|nr:hemerythrin domain-containing protein [Candidatus Eisenbacteria bacterium]